MVTIDDLYALAEEHHIPVDCFDLKSCESLSMQDDDQCYIAINPLKLKDSIDEKMKLVHELGHCATGSFYNQYAALDVRAQHENRADRWAIKKLLPFETMKEAMDNGYVEVHQLAEYFEVSEGLVRKAYTYYTEQQGLDFNL